MTATSAGDGVPYLRQSSKTCCSALPFKLILHLERDRPLVQILFERFIYAERDARAVRRDLRSCSDGPRLMMQLRRYRIVLIASSSNKGSIGQDVQVALQGVS